MSKKPPAPMPSKAITRRNRRNAYLFLLPNFLGFLVFTFIPVIFAFALSFTNWQGSNKMDFIGIDNFIRMFGDSDFTISFINTVIYTVGTVPFIMLFALLLSMLINSGIKGAPIFRALHFFPHISSIVAISVVWQFLYNNSQGPINMFLRSIGIQNPPGWLSSATWALPAVMIMIIWKYIGYYMINYLAGLQAIPKDLYEAATIDGANGIEQFFYVTLPQLKPTTFYVLIMAVIESFKVFTPIHVMTQGGPGRATSVLVYQIYRDAFVNFEMGYASAMSMALFVVIFVVTLIQFKLQNKYEN